MGAGGIVGLDEVWRMLEECAPGHTRKLTTYYWCARYNGKSFPSLPLGEHGRRKFPTIQVGFVRTMVRQLGILGCAQGQIEGL